MVYFLARCVVDGEPKTVIACGGSQSDDLFLAKTKQYSLLSPDSRQP